MNSGRGLPSRFPFKEVEESWCRMWEEGGFFHAEAASGRPSFSMVIPPPNVTGILHMGHALNNTLQDILARYKRMRGFETCWMPGTDHAGIATQNVVEKQLMREGRTRDDLGREAFLERLWEWKQRYGDTIINQLKRLGASCDWPRTRFTMDEAYSRAVRRAFVHLHRKGLIYRGRYIINWCPRCRTALSDEESEHREQQGALYHIRYPLWEDPRRYLVVATTRPETMLGDTAVAVHPRDPRYKDWIGRRCRLPFLGRELPVVADEAVDPEFGTGAVKVTPAHDPNDFAMGRRHHLATVVVMDPDGRMNAEAGEFAGMDRFEAREAVVDRLRELGGIEKIEPHIHAVGHCYRCHTVVEPYLSSQWFVRMAPLAAPAIAAVREGRIVFHPARWTKVYLNWMENIRDWCISRQIWWGHRIPVWYCRAEGCGNGEPIVAETAPTSCPRCGGDRLVQDEDVLDTWFSSWLWPFATFGWPRDEREVRFFYPTDVLFTASEIIFFWVARMIMAGLEFQGEIPFRDVCIHGTVRDAQGRKMSKSLGNAIDPLEIIDEYGADALRFSLIINSGQDLYISKEKFEIGRNFANKVWNAGRLVLSHVDPGTRSPTADSVEPGEDLADRWIVSCLYRTLRDLEEALESFRFSEAEGLLMEFFWRTYCDWYLEVAKPRLAEGGSVALGVLDLSLRMLHPFMPFVTEELGRALGAAPAMAVRVWPPRQDAFIRPDVEADMDVLRHTITTVRNIRTQWRVPPAKILACRAEVDDPHLRTVIEGHREWVDRLARVRLSLMEAGRPPEKDAVAGIFASVKVFVSLGEAVDLEAEKRRLEEERRRVERTLQGLETRLADSAFLQKAPAGVVAKERERRDTLRRRLDELDGILAGMA